VIEVTVYKQEDASAERMAVQDDAPMRDACKYAVSKYDIFNLKFCYNVPVAPMRDACGAERGSARGKPEG